MRGVVDPTRPKRTTHREREREGGRGGGGGRDANREGGWEGGGDANTVERVGGRERDAKGRECEVYACFMAASFPCAHY